MSEQVPFDPAPRPGEVNAIVARARRRKALRALVPVSSLAAVAVAASVLMAPTSRSDQQLQIADDPLTSATETAAPSAMSGPDGAPVLPTLSPSAVTLPPPLGPSPSPRMSAATQPTRSHRPGERPPYRGELGPHVEEYGYPACRQSQLEAGSRTAVHAGFCIEPSFRAPAASGTSDLAPTLSLCWQSESIQYGYLRFRNQEEADFALYEAEVDDAGRTVPGRKLYRFSDTVSYTARQHERKVLQGDCYVWQLRLDFDRTRYGAGDFLLRLETKTTTFDAAYRVFDVPFSA